MTLLRSHRRADYWDPVDPSAAIPTNIKGEA
jgi:hypothetical protein